MTESNPHIAPHTAKENSTIERIKALNKSQTTSWELESLDTSDSSYESFESLVRKKELEIQRDLYAIQVKLLDRVTANLFSQRIVKENSSQLVIEIVNDRSKIELLGKEFIEDSLSNGTKFAQVDLERVVDMAQISFDYSLKFFRNTQYCGNSVSLDELYSMYESFCNLVKNTEGTTRREIKNQIKSTERYLNSEEISNLISTAKEEIGEYFSKYKVPGWLLETFDDFKTPSLYYVKDVMYIKTNKNSKFDILSYKNSHLLRSNACIFAGEGMEIASVEALDMEYDIFSVRTKLEKSGIEVALPEVRIIEELYRIYLSEVVDNTTVPNCTYSLRIRDSISRTLFDPTRFERDSSITLINELLSNYEIKLPFPDWNENVPFDIVQELKGVPSKPDNAR